MLSGRERLFLMYQFFRTNKNLGLIHSVFDLGKVAWLGDTHIETFRNNWDSMLAGIATDMDDKLLAEALLQQHDKSTELHDEVKVFRRMEWDDPSRTYDYLIGIIDRHLDQEAEKRNRVNLDRAMGNTKPGTAAPGVAKEVCKKFLAGTCTKKWNECKFEHPRGKEGSKPAATHGGSTASGGAAPRGKSKTAGRDKSPARCLLYTSPSPRDS